MKILTQLFFVVAAEVGSTFSQIFVVSPLPFLINLFLSMCLIFQYLFLFLCFFFACLHLYVFLTHTDTHMYIYTHSHSSEGHAAIQWKEKGLSSCMFPFISLSQKVSADFSSHLIGQSPEKSMDQASCLQWECEHQNGLGSSTNCLLMQIPKKTGALSCSKKESGEWILGKQLINMCLTYTVYLCIGAVDTTLGGDLGE